MKRYFALVVALIGLTSAVVWEMYRWDRRVAEHQRDQNLLRLRVEYLERVPALRSIEDNKVYQSDVQSFLRWYFKEVTDHLNRFGGNRRFEEYLEELEARGKKNSALEQYEEFVPAAKDRGAEKKLVYEYTRRVFEELKSGDYAPYWSASSQGIHLDLLSADAVGDKIHLPLVVWGLPRDERVDDRNLRRVTSNASFRFNWRLFDEKGKLIAEMPGEGGPDGRVDWPERYIRLFPPMLLLGHYDIEKLPNEAKSAEITFSISARAPNGTDLNPKFVWKLDVPAAWKLGSGETWKGAQEVVRPEEDIAAQKP